MFVTGGTKRSSPSMDTIRTMLSRPNLDKDRSATLASHCSKTITQYKFDLMTLTIAAAEDTVRAHAKMASDAKNQLQLLDATQVQASTELLLKVIEAREQNMKKRAQELIKHKLTSFFEQAPTGINDAESVPVGAI